MLGQRPLERDQPLGCVGVPGREHARVVLQAGGVAVVAGRSSRSRPSPLQAGSTCFTGAGYGSGREAARCARWSSRRSAGLCASVSCRVPEPGPGQLLLEGEGCGVCRTDLHLLDGEVDVPHPPRVLGPPDRRRGRRRGPGAGRREPVEAGAPDGARVGVPWLGWTDGDLRVLHERPREPLPAGAVHRPRHRRRLRRVRGGGRALLLRDCPPGYPDEQARAAAVRGADRLPGAADVRRRRVAWASTASAPRPTSSPRSRAGRDGEVFAFTRAGDDAAQAFALELGAVWAGASEEQPPRAARSGDHLRPRGRAGAAGPAARSRPAAPWSAAAST